MKCLPDIPYDKTFFHLIKCLPNTPCDFMDICLQDRTLSVRVMTKWFVWAGMDPPSPPPLNDKYFKYKYLGVVNILATNLEEES